MSLKRELGVVADLQQANTWILVCLPSDFETTIPSLWKLVWFWLQLPLALTLPPGSRDRVLRALHKAQQHGWAFGQPSAPPISTGQRAREREREG